MRPLLRAVLVVALLSLGTEIPHAPLNAASGGDEIVSFNKESLKYHCVSCRSAIACTKNCVRIKKSDAIERGGKACKVCGGTCER